MTAVEAPARRLPRLERAQAAGGTRLLALLARAGIQAAIVREPDGSAPVSLPRLQLQSHGGRMGILPLGDGTRLPSLLRPTGAPDLAGAAAALAGAEPTIAALEQALQSPLHPQGITTMPAERSAVVVDLMTPQGTAARIDLPPVMLDRLPAPRWGAPPAAMLDMAVRCRVALGGCALSQARADRLAAGDVLVDPRLFMPAPAVRVITPDGRQAIATFDPAGRSLLFPPTASPSMDETTSPTTAWAALPVQLRFELPDVSVPLGTVAGLQAGAVIPLPADGPALAVVIVNGGRPVGQGELVALGDGYGVRLSGPLAVAR